MRNFNTEKGWTHLLIVCLVSSACTASQPSKLNSLRAAAKVEQLASTGGTVSVDERIDRLIQVEDSGASIFIPTESLDVGSFIRLTKVADIVIEKSIVLSQGFFSEIEPKEPSALAPTGVLTKPIQVGLSVPGSTSLSDSFIGVIVYDEEGSEITRISIAATDKTQVEQDGNMLWVSVPFLRFHVFLFQTESGTDPLGLGYKSMLEGVKSVVDQTTAGHSSSSTTSVENSSTTSMAQTQSETGASTTLPTQTTTTQPVVDATAPNAPTGLSLITPASSPSNVQTPSVRVAGVELGAMVRLYSDSNCSTPLSSSTAAESSTVDITTQPLAETAYTMYADQTDGAGNVSSCSTASLSYQYDATAPAAASPLSWFQSSPYAGTSVTAAWTKSNASDLLNQKIQFYTGASCNTESGSLIDLASASTQTRAFAGADGTTYTYKITSFDAAGNSTVSACSSILTIDTSAPAAATSLGWSESTPSSVGTVTAAWTKSAASDLSNQTIQFYGDGSCSSASGGAIDLSSAVTETRSFTGSNATYTYQITSIDDAGNPSVSACSSAMVINVLTCPTNYVKIPANTDLGTAEFCVMKYEAKNVSTVATSQASGTPWVVIARGTDATTASSAWKACKDLNITNPVSGMTFDLITNAQWQAIARNIEGVSSNWSNGSSSGSNSLNRGNSDQGAALAADASDSNGCLGITSNGDPADNCASAWHVNKRTHTLSNGEVIWDIAGNVWEWVQDNLTSQGSDNYVSQNPANVPDAAAGKLRWGPAGNFTAKNSGEYGGLGYGNLNYSGGAVLRGGRWSNVTDAGVFASNLGHGPTVTAGGTIGFRCAGASGP